MDVLNKFYSSMTIKVSQFSGVFLGNPVTREFEATEFIATAGPGLLWKVYKGYKKSTKQEVSLFIFEKKILEQSNVSKADFDLILETLKRGVAQLTKLRHPHILTVQYGLEESRDSIAFATEPILFSLANLLGDMGNHSNLPQNMPTDFNLHDLDIKYGLLNIVEGLQFLHNDVKLLHHNLCPSSILINKKRAWKIFGFDMCVNNISPVGQPASWPFKEYAPNVHYLAQPVLDYLAPEHYLSAQHCFSSDMYSLGMLIYVIFNPEHQTLGKIGNCYNRYKVFVNDITSRHCSSDLSCLPDGLQNFVRTMLNPIPELRPNLLQLSQLPYFDDIGIKTLKYIDSLVQIDNMQKANFYKSLPQIIQKLPHRINLERILPCLLSEFANAPMLPFVLPNALTIAESSSDIEYVEIILPALKKAMLIQDPIQVQLILMNKIAFILERTPDEDKKSDVLPMIFRCLDAEEHLQEMSLNILPNVVSLIDYTIMKNAVLPRLRKLCMTTGDISIKVKGLLCLSKLVEHMDKWLVLDEVVPFLVKIPMKEQALIMANLGIFAKIMNCNKLGISKEIIVQNVLPFLLPLCLDNSLTVNQFNTLMALIKQMISKVETDHRTTLEQLNNGNPEPGTAPEPTKVEFEKPNSMDFDFFQSQPASPHLPDISKNSNTSTKTFILENKVRAAPPPGARAQRDPVQSALHTNLSQLAVGANAINVSPTPTYSPANPPRYSPSAAPSSASVYNPTYAAPHAAPARTPLGQPNNSTYNFRSTAINPTRSKMSMNSPTPISSTGSASLRASNNNLMNFMASNQNHNKQDWSAFESLLPNEKKDTNENPPSLSEQEIMDLLS